MVRILVRREEALGSCRSMVSELREADWEAEPRAKMPWTSLCCMIWAGARNKHSACKVLRRSLSKADASRAYGRSGAEDVTRVYVSDFETGCRARRRALGWKESALRLASGPLIGKTTC